MYDSVMYAARKQFSAPKHNSNAVALGEFEF